MLSTSTTTSFRITSLPSLPRSPIRSRRMSSGRGREIIRPRWRRRSFKDDVPLAVYDGLIAAVRAQSRAALSLLRAAAAGAWARRSCISTTPMSRSSPRSRQTSPLTKRSRKWWPRSRRWARIRRYVRRGLARTLVRSLRIERETERRLFFRRVMARRPTS